MACRCTLGEWPAREMVNRVQKLRKKAELRETIGAYAEFIRTTVRSVPVDVDERKGAQLIIEEQEVSDFH